MSKIVQAINAMIANPELISSVVQSGDELFFLYKQKYKWSILKREDGFHLWFYPGPETIEQLSSFEAEDWRLSGTPMIHYHDAELGTREAKSSFSELFTMLSEKVYGIDQALDDIISDNIPF